MYWRGGIGPPSFYHSIFSCRNIVVRIPSGKSHHNQGNQPTNLPKNGGFYFFVHLTIKYRNIKTMVNKKYILF